MLRIYTYRYLWRVKDSTQINFKIVTDSVAGLEQFEAALLKIEGLELAAKEYINEYSVDNVGRIETIFGGDQHDQKKDS